MRTLRSSSQRWRHGESRRGRAALALATGGSGSKSWSSSAGVAYERKQWSAGDRILFKPCVLIDFGGGGGGADIARSRVSASSALGRRGCR